LTVYPFATELTLNALKVAKPATAAAEVVPCSVPWPGLA